MDNETVLGGLAPESTLPTTELPRVNSHTSDLDAKAQSERPLVDAVEDTSPSQQSFNISESGLSIFKRMRAVGVKGKGGRPQAGDSSRGLAIDTSTRPHVREPLTARGKLESTKGKVTDHSPMLPMTPFGGSSKDDAMAQRGSGRGDWVHNNLLQKDHEMMKLWWEEGIRLFNEKPVKGVKFLVEKKLIHPGTAQSVATFLHETPELNIMKIGDYLGIISDSFCMDVLQQYVSMIDFRGLSFDDSLRRFLSKFKLPGEAPVIDKMMEAFAQHYCESNPNQFKNPDTAYILAFATIMLNTDAHSRSVKKKMTKLEFVKNYKRISDSEELTREFLEGLYDRIVKNEIKMVTSGNTAGEDDILKQMKEGAMFLKYPYGKRGKPSPRRVWLSDDLSKVSWQKVGEKKSKSLYLREINSANGGQLTAAFEKSGSALPIKDELCFSLITRRRTLDLEAGTQAIRDMWLHYFEQVVERNQLERRAREITRRRAHRERRLSTAKVRWTEDVIPNWKEMQGQKRLRVLWWAGIPPSVRPKVWPLAICTRKQIPQEKYFEYMQMGRRMQVSELDVDTMKQIESDISSTFPDLSFFHDEGPLMGPLLEIVTGYMAMVNEGSEYEIDYLPGMTFLAALLLLYMDQYDAFVCLVNLLDLPFFQAFIKKDVSAIQEKIDAFEAKLSETLPAVYQKFRQLDIKTAEYLRPWYITLMSQSLPLDTATRVFDCFLLDGEPLLVRAALSTMKLVATRVDTLEEKDEVLGLLGQLPPDLTEEALFNVINFVDGRIPRLNNRNRGASGSSMMSPRDDDDEFTSAQSGDEYTPSQASPMTSSMDPLTDRSTARASSARELLFEKN